ncbi:MAG: hypothetical protein GVY08_13360 [Bacteroidetes bacterium]|jgi:two-component sensor histidine kinase|nr:hypothetical protein [Bacteroidota bacterium]
MTLGDSNSATSAKSNHILVILFFVIAASLLVVITTYAISMLTASGEFNRLLIEWNQQNRRASTLKGQRTADSGPDSFSEYRMITKKARQAGLIIDELLRDAPDPDVIFREYQPVDIHPNEVTGLIRIFTYFPEMEHVEKIKRIWKQTRQFHEEAYAMAAPMPVPAGSPTADSNTDNIQDIHRQIDRNIQAMILENSMILFTIKRYSLWLTVLLGIFIVLSGIIYTVRGIKQVKELEGALLERDRVAAFPELNQYPVLNVMTDGTLGFINQSTRSLFPEIEKSGLDHPFLKELNHDFERVIEKEGTASLKVVKVNDHYYQQSINYLSEKIGIHVHSIDITTLKEQQREISRSLHEKEMLLAEVHHRVKNNMAIISGLLELQEMMGEDPTKALTDSLARIKSMALVHEIVYNSESFSDIDVKQFTEQMAEHLRVSLPGMDDLQIEQVPNLQKLNINQAVPLGLLVNELGFYISQFAQKTGKRNEMRLSITREDSHICLVIHTTITGIEHPVQQSEVTPFRQVLIENLLNQLKGTLEVDYAGHTRFDIRFKPDVTKGASGSYL